MRQQAIRRLNYVPDQLLRNEIIVPVVNNYNK
jgi:hypothetical protein